MRRHLLTLPVLMTVFSCINNDDISIGNRNGALFGQWKYVAIESNTAVDINGDGTVNIDLYKTNEIRQCIKDNLTFFTEGPIGEKNEFRLNENDLSCGEVDPYSTVESDKYELMNNEILIFENRNEMRIIELTKSRLVLEQDDFFDNQDVVITYTYKRS